MQRFYFLWFLPALVFLFTHCDSSLPEDDLTPLDVETAENVEADPISGRDLSTGQTITNNLFTLYDIDAGRIVLSSSETDAAIRSRDSVSTTWDIGFKGTIIIFNGGSSGPGEGTAQLLSQAFAEVTEAPSSGYAEDGNNTCPEVETPRGPQPGSKYAICTGSDNGWYNYNPDARVILPIPGRTIVLTTGDGNFAKLGILSYYRDNPDSPDENSAERYYTFRYIVRPNGSRDLTSTGT